MKYAVYSLAVVVVLSGLSLGVASAANDKSPFEMIWDALTDVQGQIDNIALLPGPQGEQGPIGATSTVPGPVGPQGEKGDSGVMSNTIIVTESQTSSSNVPTNTELAVPVSCPEGTVLLSGGTQVSYDAGSSYGGVVVGTSDSYPSSTSTWTGVGKVFNGPTATGSMTVTTYAVCGS